MHPFRHSVPATTAAALLSALVSCVAAGCGDDAAGAPPRAAYDVERYDLTGEYDWARGRLSATLAVALSALDPDATHLVLDSAVTVVQSVRNDVGAVLPFTTNAAAGSLTIDVSGLADRGEGEPVVLSIAYEAAPGDALRAVPGRAGDPVGARVVYTSSEPLGAASWMPCNNRPDDRALFSIELRMAAAESLIANGDLTLDMPDPVSGRRMRYETQYPLPPYLMAFAVSEFEVVGATRGDLPLSVWHRPGVPGDYDALLDELDRQLDHFEGLLGPYPFEKYAVVMLPDFSGGMENASITFQTETLAGQPSISADISLHAHELGHQWYGDLVTVETWDDLWIKEGMATLLSPEALRAHEDQNGAGTLHGDSFGVYQGAAIRDRSLAPEDKYTSGPYDRAAWLLTQIRSLLGEDAFWGALRGVLEERRFGVVGTDDFLGAFAPALGADAAARARRAVDARGLPTLEIRPSASGGALVTLHDPEEILVAPMEIEWHHIDGTTTPTALVPEQPLDLSRAAPEDFLVVDPRDVHPDWAFFLADEESAESYHAVVAALRVPTTPAQTGRFVELAGAHQVASLSDGGLPPVAPDAFTGFVGSLDAESAKAVAIAAACSAAGSEGDPQVQGAWIPVLTGVLSGPPYTTGLGHVSSYGACGDLVEPLSLFSTEWDDMKAGLSTEAVSEARLVFLSKLNLPQPDALDAWGGVAQSGYSLRGRALAARELRRYAGRIDPAAPGELSAWRSAVHHLLGASEASEVLRHAIPAALTLRGASVVENGEALSALSKLLGSPLTRRVHRSAVCAAFTMAAGDSAAWAAFVSGLDVATLSPAARTAAASPKTCQ